MAGGVTDKPVPFVGQPNPRGLANTDQRYINVLFERIPNDVLKEHTIDRKSVV